MRGIIVIVLAVIVVGGGYYWYTSQQESEPAVMETGSETTETAPVTEPDVVDEPAQSEAADDAAEATTDDTDAAAQDEPVQDETADDAAETTTDATDADVQDEAATDATDATGTETATDEQVEGADAEDLTVAGFDYDDAITAIDESDLGEVQKTTLKAAVTRARDNPEQLREVLTTVRTALGM